MQNTLQTTVLTHCVVFKDKMEAKVDYNYAQEIIRAMKEGKFDYPLTKLSGASIRKVGDIKEIIDLEKQRQEREKGYSKYINADWNTKYSEQDKQEVDVFKEECRCILRGEFNCPIFEKANEIRRKNGDRIPKYSFIK